MWMRIPRRSALAPPSVTAWLMAWMLPATTTLLRMDTELSTTP
jgi:hypothetical protein